MLQESEKLLVSLKNFFFPESYHKLPDDLKVKYHVYLIFSLCGFFLPIAIEIIKTSVTGSVSISVALVVPLCLLLLGNHLLYIRSGWAERAFVCLLVAPHVLVPIINLLEGPYSGVIALSAILPLLTGLLLNRKAVVFSAAIMATGMVVSGLLYSSGISFPINEMDWRMYMAFGIGNLTVSCICIYYFAYVNHLHIRDRVQLEAKLAQSSRLASLGELAGGVAHEINNPLAIIVGNVGRMKRVLKGSEVDRDKGLEIAEKINEVSLRISKIVDSMKILTRYDGDLETSEQSTFMMGDLLDTAIESVKDRFEVQKVDLAVENKLENMTVNGHSTQIQQVLVNLINNAIDAAAPCPEAWVRIEATTLEDLLRVRVIDSGTGIPASTIGQIFDPFFTTKEIGHGMGLGLSISYKVALHHNGKLWVDETARNTTFVFDLPLASAQSLTA